MFDMTALQDVPRLALEADLRPLQGSRFQTTGFPDLGPARFQRPDGTEMLLVESAQSMANRLESVCWDEAVGTLAPALQGMPYISVLWGDGAAEGQELTNSILEAHRINSPYILEGQDRSVFELLKNEAAGLEKGPIDPAQLARLVFKYDPNAVLHGVFLAKPDLAGGRLRMTRALSAFIEAGGVREAESGGVKNDRIDPSGQTRQGFGNVPFHRSEFTAEHITAYFSLDLALLRGYQLAQAATAFLIALALWKTQRLLVSALRLRSACDFELAAEPHVSHPVGWPLPTLDELETTLQASLAACREQGLLAEPAVTEVRWLPKKSSKPQPTEEPEPSREVAELAEIEES